MLFQRNKPSEVPDKNSALPDRSAVVEFNPEHFVSGNRIVEPVPENLEKAIFAVGCFWGAERLFWQLDGVYSTAVGYAGGVTVNPSYEDVCSGMTGHTEVVVVFFDPALITYQDLLIAFWESHDPTQGMRQGNDQGTQYRSAIYTTSSEQLVSATESASHYQLALKSKGYPEITTEIKELDKVYYAEDYHQQYLAKNPGGYCSLAGTGVCLAKGGEELAN
ncbi:MAG: peptide-methionine (S)-S-oxide reductase [SAR86 cluster bacterium]|uniref:Peptide methionine sulfoxide reductase MsrA n=1 Tax=SAR86 cluster bacterium TaxID=2030880 RepID=A0A2A5B3I8_9GAMM|nr:MAG: peptide-methionine (S)-S-oxide reductase [SAR86 cluster bacterium]